MTRRQVRLSQTVVPFGVGALYYVLGESLLACDTTYWKSRGRRIESPRLAAQLGVDHFKEAPSAVGFTRAPGSLVYARFPTWLFCGSCRRMSRRLARDEAKGETPRCESCRHHPRLVPMRFVQACESGHLDDVDWRYWAHSSATEPNQKQCQEVRLHFESIRGAAGLGSLFIRCAACGANRSLAGINSPEVLRSRGITCTGRQPWQRWESREDCDAQLHVLQRGASNVYFANVESAIDIPPDSRADVYSDIARAIAADPMFTVILSGPDGPLAPGLIGGLAQEYEVGEDVVRGTIAAELAARGGRGHGRTEERPLDLLTAEWSALMTPQPEVNPRDRFITRHTGLAVEAAAPTPLDRLIDKIVLVTRLREVRALVGFSRYSPASSGSQPERVVTPDLGQGLPWLPAIEVFGEGFFFSLREDALQAWEQNAGVLSRVAELATNLEDSFVADRLLAATPRAVMLHTLSHVLMRRLTFETGYTGASLRERIYARSDETGQPHAGVLIYTAAGDLEGTLGGLVRLAEPPAFAASLAAAIEQARWCSADPVCIEAPARSLFGLNLAACHSCSLVPETSCPHWDLMLDRLLLIGGEGIPGYFDGVGVR